MMDKQKQLEEMIRDLIPFLVKEEFVEEILKQPFSYFDGMYEDEKAICKELIRLNYRKIQEDEIVILKKDYEDYEDLFKNFDNYLFEYRKFADNRIKETRKDTVKEIENKIQELLNTPFDGKTEKQEYQRKGMEEGLKMALEIVRGM